MKVDEQRATELRVAWVWGAKCLAFPPRIEQLNSGDFRVMVQLENVRFSGTGLRFWPCWTSLHNEIAVSEYPEEYSEGNIE